MSAFPLTFSVIKADVGSVGGHTRPSQAMMDIARKELAKAVDAKVLIDAYCTFTGDDICLISSHTHGSGSELVHKLCWDIFIKAAQQAEVEGDYGYGQDLLADAPSGNIRGAGPAVAEITFEHDFGKHNKVRPVESIMVFAADKCGPGAYNFPIFSAFADPRFCGGLLLSPKMTKGFTFRIIDMDHTDGDRIIELNAPDDYYKIVALLRDNERFGIESISSREYPDQQCASISAMRLHSIAGTYTGKDDPIALIRNQGIFPAPEEIVSPWTIGHFVGGDARGSHVMPIMPVAIETPVTGPYCLPLVSAIGFSVDAKGIFSNAIVDFFGNVAWDQVRLNVQKKGIDMRQQGWSGAAMLPYSELEYGGIAQIMKDLESQFTIRKS
ncbi:MAG: fructose 1,6-bisphosphatase [Patescibacteria group bacterium]|jgi:fructose 1,6-bisphosphate aldolase/phosphatase